MVSSLTPWQDCSQMLKKTKLIGTKVRRGALDAGSHETTEMIKAWIEHCVNSHSECAASVQTTGRLPTRLLQIEKSGNLSVIRP